MTIPTNSVVVWGFHWRRFIPLHVLWLILNSYSSAHNRRQPQGARWVCSAHERFASVGGHPVPTFPVPSWRGPLSPHLAEWVSLTRSWEHGKRASWSLNELPPECSVVICGFSKTLLDLVLRWLWVLAEAAWWVNYCFSEEATLLG